MTNHVANIKINYTVITGHSFVVDIQVCVTFLVLAVTLETSTSCVTLFCREEMKQNRAKVMLLTSGELAVITSACK